MRTEALAENVYAIDAPFEDAYLQLYVIRAERLTLIDTGVAGSSERALVAGLDELGLKPEDVDLVINTHGHHDHRGGNAGLKRAAPAARVMAHEADAHWIADVERYLQEQYFTYLKYWTPPAGFIERIRRLCGEDVPVDEYVEAGQVIDLGGGHRLRVEHVPAHTAGHVVLYHEPGRVLFTGDALQARGTPFKKRRGFFPSYSSVRAYKSSLDYFTQCGAEVVATSHWGICKPHHAAQLIGESAALLAELQEFTSSLVRDRGEIDLAAAVAATLETWPRYSGGAQLYRTVRAHLDECVALGEASCELTETDHEVWRAAAGPQTHFGGEGRC